MIFTAEQLMQMVADGHSVVVLPSGEVRINAASGTSNAARQKAYRERKKAETVTTLPENVTTPVTSNGAGCTPLPPPSSPSSPPFLSSLSFPPLTPPTSSPNPVAEFFGFLETDPVQPPKPPAKRSRTPKSDDPRIHDITSRIGIAFREITGEHLAFKPLFPKRLKSFLQGWPGTADEWLEFYREVLAYSQSQFASACRKCADPETLCLLWNSAKAEVAKLKSEEDKQPTIRPAFKT